MARELPYFKFFVSEWNDGTISDCSLEAQGLFINVCSLYWSRLGCVDKATALRKFCERNANAWKELVSAKIIKVSKDKISINFLDEQFDEANHRSDKNRKIALDRWKKHATALPKHSERSAIGVPLREDKIREDKSEIREYGSKSELFVIVKSKYIGEATSRVNGKDGLIAIHEDKQTILNRPEFAEKYLRDRKGKVLNDFSHLQADYNHFVKQLFK